MKTKLAKSQKGGNSNTLFVSAEAEVKEYTDKNGTYLLNYPVKGEATFLKVSFDMENIDFSDGVECAGESFKVTSVAAGAFAKTIESSEVNTNYNDKLQSVVFLDCACLFSKRNTDITSNIAKYSIEFHFLQGRKGQQSIAVKSFYDNYCSYCTMQN